MDFSKKMLRAVALISIVTLLNTSIVAETGSQGARSGDERVLRQALVVGVAMGIPGISVAIGIGDSVAWAGTAGYNDVFRRIPVNVNDRFCVGSITKTFVATVILQLAAEGKLDLDKTPQDYLDLEIIRRSPILVPPRFVSFSTTRAESPMGISTRLDA